MNTIANLVTADELLAMPRGAARYELVLGELRSMSPANPEHGAVAGNIYAMIHNHAKRHSLGRTFAAETGFLISRNPDTVRAPDVAFVRKDRLPKTGLGRRFLAMAPDLAVEVISPSDIRREVEAKSAAWLAAGSSVVWLVDPAARTILMQRADGSTTSVGMEDTLEEPALLPGFIAPVAEVFDLS